MWVIESSALGETICRPSSAGSKPERVDDLLARGAQVGVRAADQVDRGDQRVGLDRQQPRRAVERVRVGLGVDLDLARGQDLGVDHVGAAAEVDDVEHRDVLAQLLRRHLQLLADVGHLQPLADAARGDQHRRERHEPREALRPDRGLGAAAAAVALDRRRRRGREPGRHGHRRLAAVGLDQLVDARARLLDQRRRAEDPQPEAQRPRDQQPRLRVRRPEDRARRRSRRRRTGARRTRRRPRGSRPRRRRPDRRAATGSGSRSRAGRTRPGAGSRARPWSRRRPCPGSARAGRRARPCARARSRRGRTARPRTAGGTGRRAAARSRRSPSCGTRTRSACGGRSRCRSSPGARRPRRRRPRR